MIAILKTACGCEKAINVDYHYPRVIHVPLHKPLNFIADDEFDPSTPATRERLFELYTRRDDGILEYREKL